MASVTFDVDAMLGGYRASESMRSLGRRFGVSVETIRRHVKSAGLGDFGDATPQSPGGWDRETVAALRRNRHVLDVIATGA